MESSHIPERIQVIALVDAGDELLQLLKAALKNEYSLMQFKNGIDLSIKWAKNKLNIAAIVSKSEIIGASGISLFQTLQNKKFENVPFFIVTDNLNENLKNVALKAGITDVFVFQTAAHSLPVRLKFIIEHWQPLNKASKAQVQHVYKLPVAKRLFDIVFSSLALLVLSPLFLLIILLIKLESKGPAFYYSLRVGTGYKIFKFFKFRSMYTNADKRLKDLKHLNQYAASSSDEVKAASDFHLCVNCLRKGSKCQMPLYADKNTWCERQYAQTKKAAEGAAFIKIKDDPRITKVGKFLRNTSIDESPQLVNVLIGDMSIVGNRPLPLYEAEKLTTDKYAARFIAPAGITGLWQVEKRGKKGDMSEEERLMLDNTYAENHSFLNDIRLIFKTLPALFQQENV